MKRAILFFLAAALSGNLLAQNASVQNASVAKQANNKVYLYDYFKQTYERLQRSVSGLTEAQLMFKPADNRWSISQCLEHIVLTEEMLFGYMKSGLDAPANPERRKEIKVTDEAVIKGVEDRSDKNKATAPAELAGTGKYKDANAALADLSKHRKVVFEYLDKKSMDDLRNHISDSPFGAVDGYHSFLFLAGHTARHTAQIEEVKAHSGFPK